MSPTWEPSACSFSSSIMTSLSFSTTSSSVVVGVSRAFNNATILIYFLALLHVIRLRWVLFHTALCTSFAGREKSPFDFESSVKYFIRIYCLHCDNTTSSLKVTLDRRKSLRVNLVRTSSFVGSSEEEALARQKPESSDVFCLSEEDALQYTKQLDLAYLLKRSFQLLQLGILYI